MNIFALDASSKKISYGIFKNNKLVCEYNRIMEKGASQLVSKLEKDFKKLSLNVKSFDYFVVGAGPGSFTGLRISFSLIKAFALAARKPVFSPNSFFSCAYPFRNKERKIAVLSDARQGLVYAAFFISEKQGLSQKTGPKLMKLKDCLREGKNCLFLTYDSGLGQKILEINNNFKIWPEKVYPRAKYLIYSLDQTKIKNKSFNLGDLKPLYLHPMTCQVRRSLPVRPKNLSL